MKKLLSLILVLTLTLLCFASCKQKCTEHIDADKNFICDNCEEALPNYGMLLSDAVITKLQKAKTFKLELELKSKIDSEEWELDENGTPISNSFSNDIINTVTIEAAVAEDKRVNAKIHQLTKIYSPEAEEYVTVEESTSYLVDGAMYEYDADMDGYLKTTDSGAVAISEISRTIARLTEGVELDEARKQELYTRLGEEIIATFNIIDGKGSLSVDLKEKATSLLNYLSNLNLEEKTVRGLVDDALKLVDEELTAAKLEAELKRVMSLSVNEAMAEIDAWLTENHNTTLQGAYDSIVGDPAISTVIKNAIRLQMEESGVTDDVETIYAETFTSFTFAEMIAEAGVGDAVLYDLIVEAAFNPTEEQPAPTLDEAMDIVASFLDMTLSELEANIEAPIFTSVKEIASSTNIGALGARVDIGFTGVYDLDYVQAELNLAIDTRTSSVVQDKQDTASIKASAFAKLSGISDATVHIAAPTDKDIYYPIANEVFYPVNNTYDLYTYYNDVDGFSLELNIALTSSYTVSLSTVEGLGKDTMKSTTVTVPLTNLRAVDNFGKECILTDNDLVIEISLDSHTYNIISQPLTVMPITEIINQIGTGKGVDNSETYDLAADFGYILFYSYDSFTLVFPDTYYLWGIDCSYTLNTTDNTLDCTVKGLTVEYPNTLRYPDLTSSWYGSTSDPDEINAYLGGNTSFTIYLDGNTVCRDEIPDVDEKYQYIIQTESAD